MTDCVMCKNGTLSHGTTTVALNRGATTIVLKGVPAEICDNCGESYLSEGVSKRVYEAAEAAVREGAEVEILRFAS